MDTMIERPVADVDGLLHAVRETVGKWERSAHARPWFRGQADASLGPIPSLFRAKYDEFWMTSSFRLKARAFGTVPETKRLDEWLFLAQHFGLPTRLLDWTESPLAACLFAVEQWARSEKPEENYGSPNMAIWLLHPTKLNNLSDVETFPNTWTKGNIGSENCRMAFHLPEERQTMILCRHLRPSKYPLAVLASAVDRRVVVQRSCFTLHGTDERDVETILLETELPERGEFVKFTIPRANAPQVLNDLVDSGVSLSTVYPDFTGFATELKFRYGPAPVHKHVNVP